MLLPENSLGVSDALQFSRCPRLFHQNIRRFTEGEDQIYISGDFSMPLAYGQAMHEGAQAIVQNPEIYLDDALDLAWAAWSHALDPEHHAELKADLQTILDRTLEAPNLKLVAAEQDMKVPVYRGEADPERKMEDEEPVWYHYRFKIDALYEDLDEPGHFVIRDYKSYRMQRFQSEIDEDMQFTAYSYGVKRLMGDAVKRVTVWVDQPKHESGEVFTTRTEFEEMAFEEWMRSSIRAILDVPAERIANLPKLNDFCGWCPLLANCPILTEATDFALATVGPVIEEYVEGVPPFEEYHEIYMRSKQALKLLDAFKDKYEEGIKSRTTGDREFVVGTRLYRQTKVAQKSYSVKDIAAIVGTERALEVAGTVSAKAVKPLVEQGFDDALANIVSSGGHYRLTSSMTPEEKKRVEAERRALAKEKKAAAKLAAEG